MAGAANPRPERPVTGIARQRGFTLVTAVFLIVVVASVGMAVSLISSGQSVATVQEIQGARAFFAAAGGMEYAIARVVGGTCAASDPQVVEGFNLAISCSASAPISEGSDSYVVYELAVTASSGAKSASSFVSRTVRASVRVP